MTLEHNIELVQVPNCDLDIRYLQGVPGFVLNRAPWMGAGYVRQADGRYLASYSIAHPAGGTTITTREFPTLESIRGAARREMDDWGFTCPVSIR